VGLGNEDLEELFYGQIKAVPVKNIVLESLFHDRKIIKVSWFYPLIVLGRYRVNYLDSNNYSLFCYHYKNYRGKLKPSIFS